MAEPGAPFVGRADQMGQLLQRLEGSSSGQSGLVLVVGEPGVGKSRLASELAAAVDDQTAVLVTHCLELAGSAVALAPVQGLVHRAYRQLGAEVVRETAGAYLPMLAVLEPALANGGGAAAAGLVDQRQLFAGVRHLLEQLADARPLLVVVEDVHWADEATLDLLRYLAVTLGEAAVTIVATARAGYPTTAQLVAAASRLPHATTIEVPELAPADAARLAEALAEGASGSEQDGAPLDVARVVAQSGGNPLYLEELVAAAGAQTLPDSLRGLLLERLDGLSQPARDLVDAVAVGDPPLRYDDVLAATGLTETQLDACLSEARARAVLVVTAGGRVALRHPLIGDAAREALDLGRRRSLHRAWASGLASTTSRSPQTALAVAYHWDQASEPRAALQAAWNGAQAAKRLDAPGTRAELLDRVVALWPVADVEGIPSDLVGVLSEAAQSYELAGGYEQAAARLETALELASVTGDPETVASLLISRGRLEFPWRDGDAEPFFQRARDVLPAEGHDAIRGRLLGAWAESWTNVGRGDGLGEMAAEAVRLAQASGIAADEALALHSLGVSLGLDEVQRKFEIFRTVIELADDAGDYDAMMHTTAALVNTTRVLGRPDQAMELVRHYVGVARQRGMDRHLSVSGLLILGAVLSVDSGDLDEAVAMTHEAQEIVGDHGFVNDCCMIRADVALIRGEVDAARTELASLVPSRYANPETAAMVERAWLVWLDDGPAAAADVLLPSLRQGLQPDHEGDLVEPHDVYSFARYVRLSQPTLDRAAEAVGVLDALRQFYRRMLPHYPVIGVLDATLARVDGVDPTDAWRAAAARMAEAAPVYWRVDTLIRLAEATPRRTEATDALDTAEELARRLGSRPQLDEIDAVRGRVEKRPAPAGLTPREVEILLLVDQGLTNSQIAQTLFISTSTAGVHISNILTKTQTHNRHDAARWARDAGLVVARGG
jgi:DNA-binding NarL/FixJ family response regulator/tetratricopeptide (TPR) repeat protein